MRFRVTNSVVRWAAERQLADTFRTVHPADERLVLGGALERSGVR
ncbi:hypothetical protein P3T34_001398 [Kitasatospora sp. MAP12-44]|nr:hypothetical protein [Kitasatospora sp. MAP12-44]